MSHTRIWRPVAAVVAVLAAVAVALAVASGRTPDAKAPAAPVWTDSGADVVGIRVVDERNAILEVDLPAGRADCARDLRIERLQDAEPDRPDTIYVTVVYSSAASGEVGACPDRTSAEVTMTVTAPLRDRVIIVNSSGPVWSPDGERYRVCDEFLGCHPPADHCDPAWIDKAVYYSDIPRDRINAVRDVIACEAPWLVLKWNRDAAVDCPPDQVCPSDSKSRWLFLEFGEYGWDSFATTQAAGCAAVHAERPDFPAALCESLPALG